ncbi:hypothetical protein [Thermospira aquatica]|uniref:Uncharacterized protein n=1 Tax=Thermospira aquatica TaxID=2828656 RepID=A0AAX3BBJ7_9SPIR|nr:hypothetical protein [Thermospira aquatica]URA09625.1 hypothetical protein KDW03_09035 [Thermospira aquatica]
MKEMGYPAYPGHQAEHQKFVEEATTLYRKFQEEIFYFSGYFEFSERLA